MVGEYGLNFIPIKIGPVAGSCKDAIET